MKNFLILSIIFPFIFSCKEEFIYSEKVCLERFYIVSEDNSNPFYDKRDLSKEEIKCLKNILMKHDINYYVGYNDQIYTESGNKKESIGINFVLAGELSKCVNEASAEH